MDRQEYITYALSQIDDNTLWCEIEKELSAHIDDREQYYLDCGYDSETAAKKALEHMGSPEAAADGFSKVHKNHRRVTAIIAAIILGLLVILHFWLTTVFYAFIEETMGMGITEALILIYIIGFSAMGKRLNSPSVCFFAVIDFIFTYGALLLFTINKGYCSRIVFKFICLLTLDFDSFEGFWLRGRTAVAPYLTKLSVIFYLAILLLLFLVFSSVSMLQNPTYTLKKKHFANTVFKTQKRVLIFLALSMLVLPVFGTFDETADVTVKEPCRFNAVVIAESDSICPISEIPPESITVFEVQYNMHGVDCPTFYTYSLAYFNECKNEIHYHIGDFIEKKIGNKIKYETYKISAPYFSAKENVYIEFVNYDKDNPNYKLSYNNKNFNENICQLVSDNPENWYKTESAGEVSAIFDRNNQVEFIIEKAE